MKYSKCHISWDYAIATAFIMFADIDKSTCQNATFVCRQLQLQKLLIVVVICESKIFPLLLKISWEMWITVSSSLDMVFPSSFSDPGLSYWQQCFVSQHYICNEFNTWWMHWIRYCIFQMFTLIFIPILFYLLICNCLKSNWQTFQMLNLENTEATQQEQIFNCNAEISDSSWRSSVPIFHLVRPCKACSDWWNNNLRQWVFLQSSFTLFLPFI